MGELVSSSHVLSVVYDVFTATVSPARKEFVSGKTSTGFTGYVTSTEPGSSRRKVVDRPILPLVLARPPMPNVFSPKKYVSAVKIPPGGE